MARPIIIGGKRIPGYFTDDGKVIIFKKPKNHFDLYDGWGLAKTVINHCIETNVTEIIVKVHHEHFDYVMITTPRRWKELGVPYKHPKYEAQWILPEFQFSHKKMIWRSKNADDDKV